jgi:flagellar protein FlaG
MIDSVSVNNDNLVVNKGEGNVPSPPPSPSEVKNSESGQAQRTVEVELGAQVSKATNESNERVLKSDKEMSGKELDEKLSETIDTLNQKLARLNREVLFKVDKKINKNYISVIDKESKEVIREFPPKEIRTFIARFDEINEQLTVSKDVKSLIINLEV